MQCRSGGGCGAGGGCRGRGGGGATKAKRVTLAPRHVIAAVLRRGDDVTLVASGYSTRLALVAAEQLALDGVSAEVIDLRVINPYRSDLVVESVARTGRLLAVDGGWGPCGMAGEVIASVAESGANVFWKSPPRRLTLPFSPAPTSRELEKIYYPNADMVAASAKALMKKPC